VERGDEEAGPAARQPEDAAQAAGRGGDLFAEAMKDLQKLPE
jgi:hypothetical protein